MASVPQFAKCLADLGQNVINRKQFFFLKKQKKKKKKILHCTQKMEWMDGWMDGWMDTFVV